jgi:preprotein translocase subunit SecA
MVTNAIEKAQRKVEGRNFDIRKQLLEYDDVANDQRQIIYRQRDELLSDDEHWRDDYGDSRRCGKRRIDGFIPPMSVEEQWDIPGLEKAAGGGIWLTLPVAQWLDEDNSACTKRRCGSDCGGSADCLRRKAQRALVPACASSKSRSCCRCSTRCGKSTCR